MNGERATMKFIDSVIKKIRAVASGLFQQNPDESASPKKSKGGRPRKEIDGELIYELHESGMSLRQMEKELNISRMTLKARLDEWLAEQQESEPEPPAKPVSNVKPVPPSKVKEALAFAGISSGMAGYTPAVAKPEPQPVTPPHEDPWSVAHRQVLAERAVKVSSVQDELDRAAWHRSLSQPQPTAAAPPKPESIQAKSDVEKPAVKPAEPPLEPLPSIPTEQPQVEMYSVSDSTTEFFLVREHGFQMVSSGQAVVQVSYWHESLADKHPFATVESVCVVLSRDVTEKPDIASDLLFLTSIAACPIASKCRIVAEAGQTPFSVGQSWWYDSHSSGLSRPDRWSPRNSVKFADWIQKFPAVPSVTDVHTIREMTGTLPPKPKPHVEPQWVTVIPNPEPPKSTLPPAAECWQDVGDGKGAGFAF
jgi:hypothetical protein